MAEITVITSCYMHIIGSVDSISRDGPDMPIYNTLQKTK